MREWLMRLVDWLRRDRLDRELARELQFHREHLERDARAGGADDDATVWEARRRLGNEISAREEARDRWSIPWLDHLQQDVRYALRGLRRSPGFTATVVLTLGLGIGANAAMFGVVDRLMFRPFPYLRDPASVNRAYLRTTYQGRISTSSTFPYARYLDLQRATGAFSQYAAVSEWRLAVASGDATRVRKVAGVSASFFDFFDAPPVRGRYFFASEDALPEGAPVAVIGHALWTAEFHAGDVIGRQLKVGTIEYTVVGVAPEGFVGTAGGRSPDVFVPITTVPANLNRSATADYHSSYRWDWTEIVVRRRPGVSEAAASADLTGAYILSRAAARAINPRVLPDSLVRPRAFAGALKTAAGPAAGLESTVLLWVTGVAGIVLLIACANVANLMFARVLRRRREITVRLALGVSRGRLAAQFFTESLVLALLGCVAGLCVAQWGGALIRGLLLPEGSPFNLATDWRTLAVAAGCAVAAALLTALGPAVVATRTDLAGALKAGAREGTYQRSRTRAALLVLQGALSVALLVGAGLFVRSLRNVRAVPLGYDAEPVLEVVLDFRGVPMDSATRVAARRRLLAAAQALPGVEWATRVNSRLFASNTADLSVPGVDSVARLGRFNIQLGSPDYFRVMNTRILRGRAMTEADGEGAPRVALVSEAMGRALWPGADPIGRCIRVAWGIGAADRAPCATVVGIVENVAHQNLTDDPRYLYYLPVDQMAPAEVSTLLLRMAGPDPLAQMDRVRRDLTRVMPGDGFVTVRPLQEVVDDQWRSWRLGATLFVAFGGLALLVAAVGLYGVIAYNVAQRMHELGVRIALGARRRHILALVVGQGARFAVAGVAAGTVLALAASRWVQPLLFGLSARDPLVYGLVAATLLAVSLAACAAPALRASKADPSTALRAE